MYKSLLRAIPRCWPLLPSLALLAILYHPLLLHGQVQIHGDSMVFGVPMVQLLRNALLEGQLPLWSNLLYGGHPVFAESQMGALNPINAIIALCFPPIVGHTLLHFIYLTFSAIGMYLLCRQLRLSTVASGFSSLALVFSSFWLLAQGSLPLSATGMCIPWVLLTFERYLTSLSMQNAALFSLASAMTLFSGYPPVVHAVIIFIVVRTLASLFQQKERYRLGHSFNALLLTGTMITGMLLLLTAGQLLPLLELAGYSHRSAGIDFFESNAMAYGRGLFFTFYDSANINSEDTNGELIHYPIIGSVFICLLATFSIFGFRKPYLLPYLVATFFLLNLGVGNSSPIFEFVFSNNLIPGMSQFRSMIQYLSVGTIGICILAGIALDSLERSSPFFKTPFRLIGILLIVIALGYIGYLLHHPNVSAWHYMAPILLLAGIISKNFFQDFPIKNIALLLLVFEVLALRIQPFNFWSSSVYQEPKSAETLFPLNKAGSYKHWDKSFHKLYVFINPRAKQLEAGMKDAITALSPATNVYWNIQSIDGGMALQSSRRELIRPVLDKELLNRGYRGSATRLMNALSIKYISYHGIPVDFPPAFISETGVKILENSDALPSIRAYYDAVSVDSPEDAIVKLGEVNEDILVTENSQPTDSRDLAKDGSIRFVTIDHGAMFYRLQVTAGRAGWIFIADANYPGWNAYIDGVKTEVYHAQVLGKAVQVPQGEYELELEFQPRSVQIGMVLSIVGLVLTGLLVLFGFRRHREDEL